MDILSMFIIAVLSVFLCIKKEERAAARVE